MHVRQIMRELSSWPTKKNVIKPPSDTWGNQVTGSVLESTMVLCCMPGHSPQQRGQPFQME